MSIKTWWVIIVNTSDLINSAHAVALQSGQSLQKQLETCTPMDKINIHLPLTQ